MKIAALASALAFALGCGGEPEPMSLAQQREALRLPAPWWLQCPGSASTADFSAEVRASGIGCLVQQNTNVPGGLSDAVYVFTVEFPIFVDWGCSSAVATFKRTGQPAYSVVSEFRNGRCVAVGCAEYVPDVAEGSVFSITGNDGSARISSWTMPLSEDTRHRIFDQIRADVTCVNAKAAGTLTP